MVLVSSSSSSTRAAVAQLVRGGAAELQPRQRAASQPAASKHNRPSFHGPMVQYSSAAEHVRNTSKELDKCTVKSATILNELKTTADTLARIQAEEKEERFKPKVMAYPQRYIPAELATRIGLETMDEFDLGKSLAL
eukprot:jgi/Chlat1/7000/Chrsp56S06693